MDIIISAVPLLIVPLCTGLIVLQFFLCKRRGKWPGRILPIAGFAVAVALTLFIVITHRGYSDIENNALSMSDDLQELNIYYLDDRDGDTIAFSHLYIKDIRTGSILECPMTVSPTGALTGGTEALKYKEDIEGSLADMKDMGSISKVELAEMSEEVNFFPIYSIIMIFSLYFLPPIIYTIMYICLRRRMARMQRLEDVDKMRIEDLS